MEQSVSPEEKKDVEEKIEEVKDTAESLFEGTEARDDAVEDSKEEGIRIKEQFKGKIIKLSLAGALVEIGKEIPAVIHISQIPRPEGKENTNNIHDLLEVGQEVDVWVKKVKDGRIELTMIKPLDLEWREIKKDMVVKGTVVRMEKFGVFVEIGAERPGLVHISEMAHSYVRQPSDLLKEGDEIEAQVLEVNRRKKQIKLSMKVLQPEPEIQAEAVLAARPSSARAQQLKEGKLAEQREKTPRRQKKTNKKREEINSDGFSFGLSNESAAEAEPTAMEIAIRDAMEKAKARNKSDNKKKGNVSQEQEDILSRTLSSKAG